MKKKLAILYYESNFEKCHKLSKKFEKDYNLVFISTSFFDSLYDKDNNHNKLVKEKKNCYSFQSELFNFHKNIQDNNKVPKNYFHNFEKKYLNKISINDLIKTDYYLNETNNPREDILFHKDKTKKKYLVYLILKKIEQIINKEKIDIFLTLFPENFINNCFYQISKKGGKLFFSYYCNRDGTYTISENFCTNFSRVVKNSKNNKNKKKYDRFKILYKKKLIKPNNNLSSLKCFFLGIKNEVSRFFFHLLKIRITILRLRDQLKLKNENGFYMNYFMQKNQLQLYFVHLTYIYRSLILHLYIFIKSRKINKILKDKKYIYYPLHYFPEAYVYNQLNFDELEILKKISKIIPKEYKIIIKPHFLFFENGYEQHKISYYKNLLINKNIYFISPYFCNINLIKNAQATLSFIGTSLLQSTLVGKPAFRSGTSELNSFSGIYDLVKIVNFRKCIKKKIDVSKNYKKLFLLNNCSISNHDFNKNISGKNSLKLLKFFLNAKYVKI